jgi:hypothetical protein
MIAALVALGIFVFCTIVGLGLVAALAGEMKPYHPLLAPILGAASLIIPSVWLSELGVPLARGGPILLAVMFAAAVFALARFGHRLHLKRYWPFVPILLVGFALAAWPIFEFGFNWLSYSNDDMANYVLNAQRLVEHGWFRAPSYDVNNFNKDPTAIYWMTWTVNNERYGAETILTLALSVLRLNGFQLFMPLMAALGLMQIAVVAALVYRSEQHRSAAILTAALVATSALATFGIEYQLLAQLFGLPLLVAATILLCDIPDRPSIGSIALCSIAATGLAMVYPEISPFVFLSVAIYIGVKALRRSLAWGSAAVWFGSVALLTAVLVNAYFRNYLTVIISRLTASSAPENTHVFIVTFPFYLIPSGIPNLFGIVSGVQNIPEPWLSLAILLGMALLALLLVSAFDATLRYEPAGPPALVMLALGASLFVQQSGFGLFKEAMYIQPFLIACFVLWWLRLKDRAPRPVLALIPVALFAAFNIATQQFYVDRSRALWTKSGTTFVEITNASASHLLDEFASLGIYAQKGATFISDSPNVVFGKIESFFVRPSSIVFPSDNYLPATFIVPSNSLIQRLLIPSLVEQAIVMNAAHAQHFRKPDFLFTDDYGRTAFNAFFANVDVPRLERHPRSVLVLEDTAAQSVLNRWYSEDASHNINVLPLNRVRNHLIFVAARYGLAYYSHSKSSALFQLEPDLFYRGKTMAGMGRRLLFTLINPDKKVRFEISYTATLKDDGECVLRDPSILGATMDRHYAKVIGRGSARVFLPAIAPRMMVGQPYMMLDMDVNGTLFPYHRTGLMQLYGKNIPLDGRRLVGFVRDISTISEEDYNRISPPSYLSNPAEDLLNKNLEYSGVYEDGWISEASQFVMSRPVEATLFAVRGMVPLISDPEYHTTLRVMADEREIGRTTVGVGSFSVRFPASHVGRRVRIRLLFDHFQRLPNGDERPVAMKVFSLGFQTPREASKAAQASTLSSEQRSNWWKMAERNHVAFGAGWYPLETFGGETFRWANNDAQIQIRSHTTKNSKLVLDVAPGPGEAGRAAVLRLLDSNGHELGAVTLTQRQRVDFPLRASAGFAGYVVHVEGGGTEIPSDARILNFRVFGVSVLPGG